VERTECLDDLGLWWSKIWFLVAALVRLSGCWFSLLMFRGFFQSGWTFISGFLNSSAVLTCGLLMLMKRPGLMPLNSKKILATVREEN
jgi:hypothetical protein